jgi:hypothetical protein
MHTASGAAGAAAAAAATTRMRSFPILTRNRLRPKHYLAVHDALMQMRPDGVVKAYIDRRVEYNADMLWQLPSFQGGSEITNLWPRLSAALGSQANVHYESHRVGVEFPDHAVLSLVMGDPVWTMQDLNKERTEGRRKLLRAGLGYDMQEWERQLPEAVTLAADHCMTWAIGRFDAPALAPLIYWQTMCLKYFKRYPPDEVISGFFARIKHDVTETFWMEGNDIRNPAIPAENLCGIEEVTQLVGIYR